MDPSLKLQIFFAALWVLTMLALYMILVRTLAHLEYAMNRLEEIVTREIQIRQRVIRKQKDLALKAKEGDKGARNDLLLNIPFLDKLGKDKKNG